MNATTFFDADAYRMSGKCPWTFFAYPRVLTDDAGFPPDDDAKRLLTALRDRGIPVGMWLSEPGDTVYFACPKEAIGRLHEALTAMENRGEFEADFCIKRTEFLFSLVASNTEPTAPLDPT